MAQWTFYRLKPKPGAGFHFGLRGLGQEDSAPHCSSDTLFSALVVAQAILDGEQGVREFVAPFENGSPPFLLTSAFPFAGKLPLLPFPHLRLTFPQGEGQRRQRKLLKKLRYVSPAIFRRILAREPLAEHLGEKGVFLQDGQVWLSAEEITALPEEWRALKGVPKHVRRDWREWVLSDKIGREWLRRCRVWGNAPVDRVTVDRVSSTSSVYRVGRTVYAPGCGLWFGLQWPHGVDDSVRARLETLLYLLGDQGLGGERTVGYGQFTWEQAAFSLNLPPARSGDLALTLARYLPHRDELPAALQGAEVAYRLVAVAGWFSPPGAPDRRRRQVRFLAVGSVFRLVGAGPWGRLADVRPLTWTKHPVWRYGYACPVGLPDGRGEEVANA